jgi:hypothetical protein
VAASVLTALGNPWLAAASAVLLGVLVGASAGEAPEITWGLVAGPLVAAGLLALLFRRLALHPAYPALLSVTAGGVAVRAALAVVHIMVGLWVYGGAIDFVGYIEQADFAAEDKIARIIAAMIALVGPNVVGLFTVCVAISTVSAYLFVRAYETAVPDSGGQRFVRLTFFLLPALAFWSVFLGKDVWMFFALALSTYCFAHLLQGITMRHAAGLVAGLLLGFTIRGAVAAGLCVAIVLAIVLRPLPATGWAGYLRPVYRLALVLVLGLGIARVVGAALIRYGVESLTVEALAERAYMQHEGFALTEAGSQLPMALTSGEPSAVLAYLPLGLFTLFFRPLPWEAHNALALVASVENVFLLGLVVLRLPPLLRSLAAARREPFLVFALVAVVVVSIPLTFQWNLGTMARMRTMALPFLVLLLGGPPRRDPVER